MLPLSATKILAPPLSRTSTAVGQFSDRLPLPLALLFIRFNRHSKKNYRLAHDEER
jgi:hypothetical protein